jgi:hypothetical protein
MALRDRNIENFGDISLAAWSRGLLICVSSTSFQKISISWPQQPLTDRVSNWIFDDPFHKEGSLLVILVTEMIQPSASVNFLMK